MGRSSQMPQRWDARSRCVQYPSLPFARHPWPSPDEGRRSRSSAVIRTTSMQQKVLHPSRRPASQSTKAPFESRAPDGGFDAEWLRDSEGKSALRERQAVSVRPLVDGRATVYGEALSHALKSAAGMGIPTWKPCARSQPSSNSLSKTAWDSTPSATTL